jgi:hypothetical protein
VCGNVCLIITTAAPAEWVAPLLPTSIKKSPGSNIGPETGSPEGTIRGFPHSLQEIPETGPQIRP